MNYEPEHAQRADQLLSHALSLVAQYSHDHSAEAFNADFRTGMAQLDADYNLLLVSTPDDVEPELWHEYMDREDRSSVNESQVHGAIGCLNEVVLLNFVHELDGYASGLSGTTDHEEMTQIAVSRGDYYSQELLYIFNG